MFHFFKKATHKKLEINLHNNSMIINGTSLTFPLSLKDIEAVLGKPDQVVKILLNTFMTILVLYLNILSRLKII